MKVIEPGHIYAVHNLDGNTPEGYVKFVNREAGTEHDGTQTQEMLRACIDMMSVLIDRTNHCDHCLRWEGNDRIIKAMSEAQRQMNLAIVFHEQRVLERKFAKGKLDPAAQCVGDDGHFDMEDYKAEMSEE
jgi:hypothetical protein